MGDYIFDDMRYSEEGLLMQKTVSISAYVHVGPAEVDSTIS
jgi:hypothetical protein